MTIGKDWRAVIIGARSGLHGDPRRHPALEQYGTVGCEVGVERQNGTAVSHSIGAHATAQYLWLEYPGRRMLVDPAPNHLDQFVHEKIRQMAIDNHCLDIEDANSRQQCVRQSIGTIIQPFLNERPGMIDDRVKVCHALQLYTVRCEMASQSEKRRAIQ